LFLRLGHRGPSHQQLTVYTGGDDDPIKQSADPRLPLW
jgi:hypothetical protein